MLVESDYKDVAIVMPAYNEASSVGKVVADILRIGNFKIIVVNDNSTDRTAELASEAGATVLNLCCQLGAWGATQAGIRYALKNGYSRCVTCDADGQHDVTAIPTLLVEGEKSGEDVVIGSCMSRGSLSRHIAWRYFKFLTGLPVNDLTSGFRVYSLAAMRKVGLSRVSMVDYQDISVLLILKEFGMSFREVGVCMAERECGKSRIFNSWFDVMKYMGLSSIIAICRMTRR